MLLLEFVRRPDVKTTGSCIYFNHQEEDKLKLLDTLVELVSKMDQETNILGFCPSPDDGSNTSSEIS
jgi:hypothetical protein